MFKLLKSSSGLSFVGIRSACQKHLAKQCDINNIIARVVRGDRSDIMPGRFGDFRGISDNPHENVLKIIEAKNAYDDLPEAVRQFYPSVEAFYAALNDPHEWDRLREFGVMLPKEDTTSVTDTTTVSAEKPAGSDPAAHADNT